MTNDIAYLTEMKKQEEEIDRLKAENVEMMEQFKTAIPPEDYGILEQENIKLKAEVAELKHGYEGSLYRKIDKLKAEIAKLKKEREELKLRIWEVVGEEGLNGSIRKLEEILKGGE